MPRQAIYTLASRDCSFEDKLQIVKQYKGQTKNELIDLIREKFPLSVHDGRRQNAGENAIRLLKQLCSLISTDCCSLSTVQRHTIADLITTLSKSINECEICE